MPDPGYFAKLRLFLSGHRARGRQRQAKRGGDNRIDGLFRANASRVNLARAMEQVDALR